MGNNLSTSFKGSPENQVSGITSLADSECLCPIQYVYDYLPFKIEWLKPQPLSLSDLLAQSKTYQTAPKSSLSKSEHSIRLDPQAANLPTHTGLEDFRQNKYWQVVESATRELLELFARDPNCAEIMVSDKRSMSSLAEEQLKREVLNTYCRFSMYMFPDADQRRIELLAQCIVLIFVFDDMWEETSSARTIEIVREKLVSRLQGSISDSHEDTTLERKISEIRAGLIAQDEQGGDAGAEILRRLIDFCFHVSPTEDDFDSVSEYLKYRWEDIANGFTWACARFAIRSNVNQEDPRFHRILHHLGNHTSIANDIASYEKEKRRVETGRATSMINVVHVIMRVDCIDAKAAKTIAYAWQLHTESAIRDELEEMKTRHDLGYDDWKFIEACMEVKLQECDSIKDEKIAAPALRGFFTKRVAALGMGRVSGSTGSSAFTVAAARKSVIGFEVSLQLRSWQRS